MEDRLPRKLAAILYADVAGYSCLSVEDEDATHRRLSEYPDLISATVEDHRGRVVHYAGDAVVARFEDCRKPYRPPKLASSRSWQRLPSGSTKFATVPQS